MVTKTYTKEDVKEFPRALKEEIIENKHMIKEDYEDLMCYYIDKLVEKYFA